MCVCMLYMMCIYRFQYVLISRTIVTYYCHVLCRTSREYSTWSTRVCTPGRKISRLRKLFMGRWICIYGTTPSLPHCCASLLSLLFCVIHWWHLNCCLTDIYPVFWTFEQLFNWYLPFFEQVIGRTFRCNILVIDMERNRGNFPYRFLYRVPETDTVINRPVDGHHTGDGVSGQNKGMYVLFKRQGPIGHFTYIRQLRSKR